MKEEIKLNLGCGPRNFGLDWDHIDGGDYSHLKSKDIFKLPYEDESVSLIYSSHVIEYIDREEIKTLLTEWKRVLKQGGHLRLAVPDFSNMSALYSNGNLLLKDILGPLYGKMSMGEETIYHKTVYDFKSLKGVLETMEFDEIARYDWRKTEHSDFDDHSQAYIPHMDKEHGTSISLNVQCKKRHIMNKR